MPHTLLRVSDRVGSDPVRKAALAGVRGAAVALVALALAVDLATAASPGAGSLPTSEQLRERAEWFQEQREYPRRAVPPGALERAQQQAARLDEAGERFEPLLEADATAGDAGGLLPESSLAWTLLGPRPIESATFSNFWLGSPPWSGRVTALAPDPRNAAVAYAGGAAGGVWKTTNGGGSWTPVFDAQPTMVIGSLAVDPNNPQVVYAGTGESNNSLDSYYGRGMFKSTDGGATWNRLTGLAVEDCAIGEIAVQPGNSNIVLAAVSEPEGGPGATSCSHSTTTRPGLYRSVNGGTTWSRLFGINYEPTDLAVDSTGSTWWAGVEGRGVWRSTDAGASWVEFTGGSLPSQPEVGRVALDVAPGGQRVYVAMAKGSAPNAGTLLGIWTTGNGGTNWSKVSQPSTTQFGSIAWYALIVEISPTDSSTFYVGSLSLFRFTGAGTSFADIRGPVHVDFHASATDASGRVWFGSDGGVYRTADSGASFANLNAGLAITQFNAGTSLSAGGRLIGGTQDNGTLRHTGSVAWRAVHGGDGGPAASHPTNPDILYAQTQTTVRGSYLSKSVDGGLSWTDASTGIDLTDPKQFYAPLVMDPGLPARLYHGTDRIWRTVNSAASWQPISQHFGAGSRVTAIGPAPSDPSTVYAGTFSGGLMVTRDGGATPWVDRNAPGDALPVRTVTDIAVDPANAGTAYVTVSGFGTGHVFRTTNHGVTWTDVSGAGAGRLPDAPVNAVGVDWRGVQPTLFVGTDVGVFWSSDGGTTWNSTSQTLPAVIVMDLLIDTSTDRVIAFTHGRGAYAAPLPTAPVAPPPNDDFADAEPLPGSSARREADTNTGATKEALEPGHAGNAGGASVWYRWTAPGAGHVTVETAGSGFDTLLAVYTGALGALTQVASNDDVQLGVVRTSRLTFTATAGTTYRIAVDGYNAGGGPERGKVSIALAHVPNDAFENAIPLAGASPGREADTNRGATKQAGEPAHAGNQGGASVWYRWTAPADGVVRLNTAGSNYDTLLAVYTGAAVNTLTHIASNDDLQLGQERTSALSFEATAGTTYRIAVDGFNFNSQGPETGTHALNLDLSPPNDDFADAHGLSGESAARTGDTNEGATEQPGEPDHAGNRGGASVWYSWTAPADGLYLVDTSGSDFDTLLAVYTGGAVDALSLVAANDDEAFPDILSSFVIFEASAGTTYRFAVDGFRPSSLLQPSTGSIDLHLDRLVTLEVSSIGTGSGKVMSDPAAIDCGDDCFALFFKGQSVTLTATPDAGSTFQGWGGACSGTAHTCNLTLNDDAQVTAGWQGEQPQTAIADGPPDGSTSTSRTATFSFTGLNAASFECRLDDGDWLACTSPKSYSGLPDGQHSFDVRGKAAGGAVDATPARRVWTIDATPPDTTIDAGPAQGSVVASGEASFNFHAEGGASFQCRLDDGDWTGCGSPQGYFGLADGGHVFAVRARDEAGNVDLTPAVRGWTVDRTAPDTGIGGGPAEGSLTSSRAADFSLTSEPGAVFECRLDNGGWGSCGATPSYRGLADGAHVFEARARDLAGNMDSSPARRGWSVDGSPPDTTIDSGPAEGSASNSREAIFVFSSEPGSVFECRLDGASWGMCSSPQPYRGLDDGIHAFEVRARDLAGNLDATPARRTWSVEAGSEQIVRLAVGRQGLGPVRSRGLRVRYSCLQACRISWRLLLLVPGGSRAAVSERILAGRGAARHAAPVQARKVTIRLTRRARALLRGARRARFDLKTTAVGPESRQVETRRIVVRR